jgi:hypothetical protein
MSSLVGGRRGTRRSRRRRCRHNRRLIWRPNGRVRRVVIGRCLLLDGAITELGRGCRRIRSRWHRRQRCGLVNDPNGRIVCDRLGIGTADQSCCRNADKSGYRYIGDCSLHNFHPSPNAFWLYGWNAIDVPIDVFAYLFRLPRIIPRFGKFCRIMDVAQQRTAARFQNRNWLRWLEAVRRPEASSCRSRRSPCQDDKTPPACSQIGVPGETRAARRIRNLLRPANAGMRKQRKETEKEIRIRRDWRRRALPILGGPGRCMSAGRGERCRVGGPGSVRADARAWSRD